MALVYSSCSQPSPIHSSRQTSWPASCLLEQSSSSTRSITPVGFDVASPSDLDRLVIGDIEGSDNFDSLHTPNDVPDGELLGSDAHLWGAHDSHDLPEHINTESGKLEALDSRRPFQKWVRSLHRRARQNTTSLEHSPLKPWQQDMHPAEKSQLSPFQRLGHRNSSSGSSFGFVSAIRSASVSLSSVSAITRTRRNTIRSQCLSRTDRSSRASMSCPRASEESTFNDCSPLRDAVAMERSLQRRRILEELISTEEGYIGDVRFLMNVYVTILASLPTSQTGLRASINQNLTQIIELHEEILGELHRVVPHSEYTQLNLSSPATPYSLPQNSGYCRLANLDAVPEGETTMAWLCETPGMISEPQIAAEVSKIIGKKMNRFFIYKEYGAKYEMMMNDIATAQRAMPEWDSYQKGLETLASTLGTVKSKEAVSKKSLTIGDLLVKPIQRICKYPLLFSELLKYTPSTDCPNSHMEVESVLVRLREATAEINQATNDVRMRTTLERTWLLQDRLIFLNRKLDAASKTQIRSFGHIRLCGVLYICWQTKDGINGQYLICLLYRNVLCLASAGKVEPVYTILACIDLQSIKIEEVDNGRGLQCHTAPFSWKLVFECDYQLHEVIMTACTAKEEMEWRARLAKTAEGQGTGASLMLEPLGLDIKSFGTVFGKPGTLARRLSIHRATTVGPKSPLCQVILKNTSIMRDAANDASAALTINRSRSLLTTNHRVAILTPPRSERARLEALLTDVWSRDVLPYPGMTMRSRSEHLVRSSASSVMRKLSVASITSSFVKRSSSVSQKAKPPDDSSSGEAGGRQKIKSASDEKAIDHFIDADLERTGDGQGTGENAFDVTWAQSRESIELMDVLGTIRQRSSAKETVAVERKRLILRTSSSNSLRPVQTTRSDKSASFSLKENLCQQTDGQPRPYPGRWAGGGIPKSTGKVHGFRSLFR